MKFGVDARPLSRNYLGGIGMYLLKILSNSDRYLSEDDELYLYSNQEIVYRPQISNIKVHYRISFGKPSLLWLRYRVPKFLIEDGIDVFWGPNQVLPKRLGKARHVVTVHDLALLVNGSWGNSPIDTFVQKELTSRSALSADAVLSDSESTSVDLVELLNIDQGAIFRVYCGVENPDSYNEETRKAYFSKCGISDRYYLYYGDLNYRKNVDTIISAFNRYCLQSSNPVQLVLAGGNKPEKYDQFLSGISDACRKRVVCPGYISEVEKAMLLEGSIALVFPSRYEGFGIPIVEAMRSGTLVITSNNSSLPEVAGKSAFYLANVDDSDELARLLDDVQQIPETERNARIIQGMEYSKQFSWEICAEETFELLRRVGDF